MGKILSTDNSRRSDSADESGVESQDTYVRQAYVSYRQAIYNYIKARFKREINDPEDVVQHTFLHFVEHIKNHDVKNPKAFLFASARNIAIDEYRKSKISLAHKQSNNTEIENEIKLNGDYSPENVFLEREELEIMCAAIGKLPTTQRMALLSHRLDNLTYSEIAEKIGVSETTIRRQIALALERIHREIKRAR